MTRQGFKVNKYIHERHINNKENSQKNSKKETKKWMLREQEEDGLK